MKQILGLLLLLLVSFQHFVATHATSNSIAENESDDAAISPATPLVTPVTNSPMQPIMRAIEIIEFVSKFSNSESEGFGVAQMHSALEDTDGNDLAKDKGLARSNSPLTALSSLAVYGVMKIASFFLSILMYFVALINPGAWSSRAMPSTGPFDHIDYNGITDSIRSISARSFQLFDIREAECQNRAMCEVGQSISSYFPSISRWVRFAAEQFNLRDVSTEAIVRGLGWSDCKTSYKSCQRSPFKKFHTLISTFTKLY